VYPMGVKIWLPDLIGCHTCRILGTVRSVLLYVVDTCGDYRSPELVQGMNLLFNSPPGAEAYFVKSMHAFTWARTLTVGIRQGLAVGFVSWICRIRISRTDKDDTRVLDS
jgi:hypothetical protein